MGPSTSWDPWPRPVTREAVGTQECTQIGENGLSGLFWVICVHCCDLRGSCARPWGRRSVHKLVEMASRRRFGSFVYTVATREGHASGRGDAGVYTNRRKWPLGVVLGHLCTLLRLARVMRAAVGAQECTQIGGNGLSELFWGICVHCCDLRGSCARPGERRRVHKSAKMASRGCFGSFVYTVATREDHARVVPPLAGVFAEAATHTNPRGAPYGDWTTSIGTHRRKVRSLSARRAPLVRREMRQAH